MLLRRSIKIKIIKVLEEVFKMDVGSSVEDFVLLDKLNEIIQDELKVYADVLEQELILNLKHQGFMEVD